MSVFCLIALVPVVNTYVAQQQRLSALQHQVAQQEQDVQALELDVQRWDDPAYVAAQARERLMYVMPGETQYRLTDTSGREVPQSAAQREAAEASKDDWFVTMWESVGGASRLDPTDIDLSRRDTSTEEDNTP